MSDAAIASIVTGIVTVATLLIGFLTLWVKLRYGEEKTDKVEKKIDDNTVLTKAATVAAAQSAAVAVETATESRKATAEIAKKLNGGVDSAIEHAVKPLRDAFAEHAIVDEANMKEIRVALEELRRATKGS